MKYKLAFVEDDIVFSKVLKSKILALNNVEFLNNYITGEALIDELPYIDPNLLLIDLNLPKMSGVEVVKLIKEIKPHVFVLVLTALSDDELILSCLKNGADGYILKKDLFLFLDNFKDFDMNIQSMFSFEVSRIMLNFFKKDSLKVKNFELILNDREFQVLRYLSDGLSNKEISDKIFLSIESVKKITQSIYTKLNVKNRSQAINAYLKK